MQNTTFSTFEDASAEQERQGLKLEKNKAKEKTYYTKPVTNYFRGREVVSNIIYSLDTFNPGPMKYRIFALDGSSKVVEAVEYGRLKDDVNWFDSEGDAQKASYSARLDMSSLGKAVEKKKVKTVEE